MMMLAKIRKILKIIDIVRRLDDKKSTGIGT